MLTLGSQLLLNLGAAVEVNDALTDVGHFELWRLFTCVLKNHLGSLTRPRMCCPDSCFEPVKGR